jgi:hypothetical protein
MNVMDAGLRDNFGIEVAMRYLVAIREWARANAGDVILLQIRDTRETEVFKPTDENSLGRMLADPATVIARKWEPFQSYYHNQLRDLGVGYFGSRFHYFRIQYMPQIPEAPAALNFHLSTREKEDLLQAIDHPWNREVLDSLQRVLAAAPR